MPKHTRHDCPYLVKSPSSVAAQRSRIHPPDGDRCIDVASMSDPHSLPSAGAEKSIVSPAQVESGDAADRTSAPTSPTAAAK